MTQEDILREAIRRHTQYSLGSAWKQLSENDLLTAVALGVRDQLIDGLLETDRRYDQADAKRLYYLSMEFLMGRALRNNLSNLGLYECCEKVLQNLGNDLEPILASERDPALGNGGLGRLAACFLDSLATLGMPGYGYGINYEYGLFRQQIEQGYQKEKPDDWQEFGTPWLIERPSEEVVIPLYGRIAHDNDRTGEYNPMWMDWSVIIGVPSDLPIVGYGGNTVNYLRLYAARASHEFDIEIFNTGDYARAVEQKVAIERVSKVLYPCDATPAGQELRLIQGYFFVACAIRDIVKRYERTHTKFENFPDKVAIQLNDTHPSLAITELMRLLVDERSLEWEQAWSITRRVMGYTNHTLLPEALERWPVPLLERVLPRHLQIIFEIDRRFQRQVSERWPGDTARLARMAIVEQGEPAQVRMAHLAIAGSHSVNGVAELHTELIKTRLVPDFYALWPERFNNKTNGVTPRRWLLQANPQLARLITDAIGPKWVTDLDGLHDLEAYADDGGFQDEFEKVKQANKTKLVTLLQPLSRLALNPASVFDVQIKRIHEYKRQLLNIMNVIHLYLSLIDEGRRPKAPRLYIFSGKAAPGYWAAKQIIKLIHNVASVVNQDPRVRDDLRVVFIPDYRVSVAEWVIPAADVSEQISTAGKEASGTGNMKFALNGALTIGTLDGANIEIQQEVGRDNMYIFGLTSDEIQSMRDNNSYDPRAHYELYPEVRRVVDALASNQFCPNEPELFHWILRALLEDGDHYFHLADLPSYIDAHRRVDEDYLDRPVWLRKTILNVARVGKFSSDRAIREYARDIWRIESH